LVITSHYVLAIVLNEIRAYLLDMNKRNDSLEAMSHRNSSLVVAATKTSNLRAMTAMLQAAFALFALTTLSMAAELPEAPSSIIRPNAPMIEIAVPAAPQKVNREVKPIDKTFVTLAIISTGSTFADSYTTTFARENWLAGKTGVCNKEVESAYLYGTHPTAARAYAVASVKSASSVLAAYYLRKHHSKFWSLPLVANSAISLQGVTQNMIVCN